MLDPELEQAFRNVTAKLRDSNGNPPDEKRVQMMLRKFERIRVGNADDWAYAKAVGKGWKYASA